MKKTSKKGQPTTKGMSTAVVLSLLVHGALFLLAGMLVVFTVVKKEEKKFTPPVAIERPKMKLRKPKVKVKKTSKPKPTTRIVTKMNRANMPEIQLPEMSGMGNDFASEVGGFDMIPDLGELSVFGASQTIGNDFEGQLYDIKRRRDGRNSAIDDDESRLLIDRFIQGGWRESDLSRYYRAPKKLYTTHFAVPPIISPMAPDFFGDPEMESYFFFVKYKGQLVYPEDIKFRFWGTGDAYAMIQVGGEMVWANSWLFHQRDGFFNTWKSSSADHRKYQLAGMMMAVGDWIELKAGEPVEMEILYGEWRGGALECMILVEVDGVEYPTSSRGGPLLPVFKTEEFTQDQLDEIRKYLPEGECSLTNGPVFRDFNPDPRQEVIAEKSKDEVGSDSSPAKFTQELHEIKMRDWSLMSGRMLRAKLILRMGNNIILQNKRGKMIKIHEDQFSKEDHTYIQLNSPPDLEINFSKTSKQRTFPFTLSALIPRSTYFTFKTSIKKKSTSPYDQELSVEYFAIGKEYSGDIHRLLEYKKESFFLNKESKQRFTFSGNPVEVMNYENGLERRGEKYEGYLVVVTDSRGKIIAHKASSKTFFRYLDNLRQVPVGRYFDESCIRVSPSRPKPYGVPEW